MFDPDVMDAYIEWLCFRPHDWGAFFNQVAGSMLDVGNFVFVPMIGELFSISNIVVIGKKGVHVFVPMIGELFSMVQHV